MLADGMALVEDPFTGAVHRVPVPAIVLFGDTTGAGECAIAAMMRRDPGAWFSYQGRMTKNIFEQVTRNPDGTPRPFWSMSANGALTKNGHA